jgi:hypothetical protein
MSGSFARSRGWRAVCLAQQGGNIRIAAIFTLKAEQSFAAGAYIRKESPMATEPKRREPDIPAEKPDIQPEPRPEEIPQDKDVPEKEAPMQL